MRKLLSILLIIAFLPCQIFAQDNLRAVNIIPDASGGLKSHFNAYLTPENSAIQAENIRVNKDYGSVSSREVLVSEIYMGVAASVNGLHRYYQSDGDLFTVAAISTLLRYDASGTATTISNGLTDGKRWQFVTYKDLCIGGNGYDQPVKWDGYAVTTANTTAARTAGDLCAQLGAPFAELLTGTTLDAAAWYQYKICHYDGTTYRFSNARSNPLLTGAAVHDIKLTGIPLGPTGTTHRYIYRTLGNASRAAVIADTTFYLIKDLADNTTTTWNDVMADDDADDDTAPTWTTASGGSNVTPPLGSILEIFNERLFSSGNTTAGYQSDVAWSENGKPDIFKPTKYVQIRPDDGDKVTFVKVFLGVITVGKTNTISRFYTEGLDVTTAGDVNWYVSNPFSFVGCPAPYSVAVTPLGIFYLGRHGWYRFTGQASELISDVVTKEIEDISVANIGEVVGFYWNNECHLSYASEASSSATNNRVLVYDLIRNAYVIDTKNVNCFAAFGSGTDYGTLYSGSSTADGYIFAHSPTLYTLLKKYKSELDSGTFSGTETSGTESSPILSMITLDNMDSYTTDTLAQASYIASDTTANKKVPPDLGSGVDGSKTVDADETLTAGEYNYTDLTVDAGMTLTLPSGTVLKVLGTIDVNGNIFCQGTATIYCHTFDLAASCYVSGAPTIRCNTLTNAGTITGNMSTTGALSGSAVEGDRDDNFAVATHSCFVNPGSQTISSTITFDAPCNIAYMKSNHTGDGNGNSTRGYTLSLDGGVVSTYSQSGASSYNTGETTYTGPWNNATYTTDVVTVWSAEGVSRSAAYEFTSWAGTPVLDFVAGALGTVTPTPAAVSTSDYVYALDVFSESTITNQGAYSLKVVVPPGADTLDENLTKTITAVDLSDVISDVVLMDVYSLRTGTNFQFGMGAAAISEILKDVAVTASNTWETVTLQMSDEIEDCEDAWNEQVVGDVTASLDTTDYKVGSGSAKFAIAAGFGAAPTVAGSEVLGDIDVTGYTDLYMWVKSSVALDAGDWQIGIDEHADCASASWFDIPALAAATWTRIRIDISGGVAGYDHTISIGIQQVVDKGAMNLWIDDVRMAEEKAAITTIGFKFTDTDDGNVVYIDNVRPASTTATWISPIYDINAGAYKKLYWNENLNTYGNIIWEVQTSDDSGMAGATYGADYTNPNGSDISAESAKRYFRLKATLTTTDTTTYLYPWLYQADNYVWKLTYSKVGSNYETTVSSIWKTGWRSFGNDTSRKLIKRIVTEYEGEEGIITVDILGSDNAVHRSYEIDLSVLPDDDVTDKITGTSQHKVHTWDSPVNSATSQSLISNDFTFTVTYEDDGHYRINRMRAYVNDMPFF